MRLNKSLERVSAVQDGETDLQGDQPGIDGHGIHLDLVHEVTASQGWGLASMSQLPAHGIIPLPYASW